MRQESSPDGSGSRAVMSTVYDSSEYTIRDTQGGPCAPVLFPL
jgi:hypothetical protein